MDESTLFTGRVFEYLGTIYVVRYHVRVSVLKKNKKNIGTVTFLRHF